ncbi:MAG: phospho-N-acetylmuramoyl-pentapeptide-transferase [Cyclobacteriaceae bacterium]
MLYYLFDFLERKYELMGAGVFQFISFRAGMAITLSLVITITFGKWVIGLLRNNQMGETVRDLGLDGQKEKEGTPTMGGILIITAIVLPTLLFAKLDNIYIILMLVTTMWMGAIGFADDYLKVKKDNKEGLSGRFKVIGQIVIGLIIAWVLLSNDSVLIREFSQADGSGVLTENPPFEDVRSLKTTIPFVKDNELDYKALFGFAGEAGVTILYVLLVIFIVTSVSNGANMTDGLDGLAAGTSAIIGLTLAIFAYVSGNVIFSDYLNIMYIPDTGELVIFCTAFVGACVGFLWYNAYPAQVFMGDTGSLTIGGIIAVLAIVIRKELMIPILCGIFVIENLSVVLQVSYFKYTKKKYGEGRRIFKMSPLHHHYQMQGVPEAKIVNRFWIAGIFLAIATLATLKLR